MDSTQLSKKLTEMGCPVDCVDVFVQVMEKAQAENKALKELVGELKEYIEHLGEMSDTCTKSYTGDVCKTCKCGKAKQHMEG